MLVGISVSLLSKHGRTFLPHEQLLTLNIGALNFQLESDPIDDLYKVKGGNNPIINLDRVHGIRLLFAGSCG